MTLPRISSIAQKLRASYMIIIALMLILPATTIISSIVQASVYDRMITNVSKANALNQVVKNGVSNAVWEIVAGNVSFTEGNQYNVIISIKDELAALMNTTSSLENRQLLEVTGRALGTLTGYVDQLGDQMAIDASVSENEKILEEIRGVSSLIADILQDFIVLEIESSARANERIKTTVWMLAALQSLVLLCVTLFAVYAQRSVSRSINNPIRELEKLSSSIAAGDLDARAVIPNVNELDNLTKNLNFMAKRIRSLIDMNIREQKNLQKSEMKALQAQITPHFLYNTFDTIIWLAEAGKSQQVIDITRAFSSFFRVSLSRGKEWITVEQEIEHIQSYLVIQKIRYRDILDYSIEIDNNLFSNRILKLLLQPLVENALYHGIKNKRGKGTITIVGQRKESSMVFTITDNGCGMQSDRLREVMEQIEADPKNHEPGDVYGLFNVTRRLRLYYGEDATFAITSEWQKGTVVTLTVPEVAQDV